MRVLTDYPERIPDLERVYLGTDPNAPAKLCQVQHMRMLKGYALLKLEGVNTRNDADLIRGLLVMIAIDDAVPLEDDEIYLFQLIGMNVQTREGVALGILADVLETGANDVYIVQSDAYGEILIPVTDETIVETDADNNMLTVDLPEGLLPDLP